MSMQVLRVGMAIAVGMAKLTPEATEQQLADVQYGIDVKFGYSDAELLELIQTNQIHNHNKVCFRGDYTASPAQDSDRTDDEWTQYHDELTRNLISAQSKGSFVAPPALPYSAITSAKQRKRNIEWAALLSGNKIDKWRQVYPSFFNARKVRRYLGGIQGKVAKDKTDAEIDAMVDAASRRANGITDMTDEQMIAAAQDGSLVTNVCIQDDFAAMWCHDDEITDPTARAIREALLATIAKTALVIIGVDASRPARPFIPPRIMTDAELILHPGGFDPPQQTGIPMSLSDTHMADEQTQLGMGTMQFGYSAQYGNSVGVAPTTMQPQQTETVGNMMMADEQYQLGMAGIIDKAQFFYSAQYFADNAPRYFIKHGHMHRIQ